MEIVQTAEGEGLFLAFLDDQINRCVGVASSLADSQLPRVSRLYALFSSIIEDAISIRILGNDGRTNQAYIIARALLERIANFCFLQLCTEEEFSDYLDYSLNKAGRRLDRSIEAGGKVQARISLHEGDFVLPPELAAAISKFTSDRGREKTRWTNVSLPERVAVIEAKVGQTGLFVSLLTIYADASEALHGTLYGSVFHLGAYDAGAVPTDQASLDRYRHTTLSCLYLMTGGSIGTLLTVLKTVGETNVAELANDSLVAFEIAAVKAGLR